MNPTTPALTERDKSIIAPVEALVNDMISKSITLHHQITPGRISYALYSDYFEIANYQLASLDSVLLMVNSRRYREAFALLRTSLENMMSFKLMTRGSRYFLLFKRHQNETIAQAVQRFNAQISDVKNGGGKTPALRAEPYPSNGKLVQVIYEGPFINGTNAKGNLLPYYFELYRSFDSQSAFLEEEDYFDYLPAKLRKWDSADDRKSENKYLYKHYMSYSALVHSLKINRAYTIPQITRLKAHYHFLGEFVHPTERSIEKVKLRNSQRSHVSSIEELRELYPSLHLLGVAYTGYIAASFAEDLIALIQGAPKKYVAAFDAGELRRSLDAFYSGADFFWFIQNGPHAYDKFQYCVNHIDAKTLGRDYHAVDPKKVKFEKDILRRFIMLQKGLINRAWDEYVPPFSLSQ